MIYIFDIDGTLADVTHRLHFIQQEPKDWDGFFRACVDDLPIEDVIDMAWAVLAAGDEIVFITGRSGEVYGQTVQWLRDFGKFFDDIKLYMRREGDHRPDDVVKSELLDQLLGDYPDKTVAGVFEDRQQVVDMYRARGLRVYQVAKGDF